MSSLQVRIRLERPASALTWFSARLRFAILTDQLGLERFFDSVILLRAPSREAAFARALAQGRGREQNYRNEQGVGVRWRLESIVSLDAIPDEDWNGLEILGMPVPAATSLPWDHEFHPERSTPVETRA
jgi:hypothetical protein